MTRDEAEFNRQEKKEEKKEEKPKRQGTQINPITRSHRNSTPRKKK